MFLGKNLPLFDCVPIKLYKSKLPNNIDVLRAVFFEKKKQNISVKCAKKTVAKQVKEIWDSASISTLSFRRVEHFLDNLMSELQRLIRLKWENTDRGKQFIVSIYDTLFFPIALLMIIGERVGVFTNLVGVS